MTNPECGPPSLVSLFLCFSEIDCEHSHFLYFILFLPVTRPASYYKVQETPKDWICSLEKDSGMHDCSKLPHSRSEGKQCNDSATPHLYNPKGLSTNGSCINWNQYYTDCRAGEKNPFQGAISFDNIGLAWVAIFLVSKTFLL